MRRWIWPLLLALVASAGGLVACGGSQPGPVQLTERWPAEPRSYDEVVRDWTRSATLRRDFDTLLEVHATYKSPEWRAALVARRAELGELPDSERAALLEQQKSEAAAHHEIVVVMSTYEGRENDLQKGKRSVWTVALVDDQGNRAEPVSIKRDRRPDDVIRAEHPHMNDFAEAYLVRFARDAVSPLHDGARTFSLRISSARGAVELVWNGR
jgi:hypothetical protein